MSRMPFRIRDHYIVPARIVGDECREFLRTRLRQGWLPHRPVGNVGVPSQVRTLLQWECFDGRVLHER